MDWFKCTGWILTGQAVLPSLLLITAPDNLIGSVLVFYFFCRHGFLQQVVLLTIVVSYDTPLIGITMQAVAMTFTLSRGSC